MKQYECYLPQDTTPGLVQMVDTFAKPKMCLLVDVIQWFLDQKITYEPQSIYEDVQVGFLSCWFVVED